MNISPLHILFPYLTLGALVIGLFTIRSRTILRMGVAVQIGIAFFYGLLAPAGVVALLLFWGLSELNWLYPTAKKWLNFCRMLVLIAIAIVFANHLIPGFHNLKVIDGLHVSPASSMFTMYLNFDKTIVAVILVIASGILLKNTRPFAVGTLIKTVQMITLCLLILIPLAVLTGYVTFDPKFPTIFWLWALNNLLFVCFAEEVIFRGMIQHYFMPFARERKWPVFIPIFIAAVLFGTVLLGHAYGGWVYISFATIAGIFYGYAYYLTQRLEAAILTHFGVNVCHFLLFAYPVAG